MSLLPTYSALHLLSTISAEAMTSGVLASSKALADGDVRSSLVPRDVPAKATEQCPWYSVRNWSCYEPDMVGSRPEGGCTMTLHDLVDERFF